MSETSTYIKNYNTLKDIAESLETQEEPDIDKILPAIDAASKAYSDCMSRIEKVKKVLEKNAEIK